MQTDIENLINWKSVSRALAGNDTSIRKKTCPQKYEQKVQALKKLVGLWHESIAEDQQLLVRVDTKDFLNVLTENYHV
jgi:hypothetical protein